MARVKEDRSLIRWVISISKRGSTPRFGFSGVDNMVANIEGGGRVGAWNYQKY